MSVESIDDYEMTCLEVGIEHASPEHRIDAGSSIVSLLESSKINEEDRARLSNLLLKLTVDQVRGVRQTVIQLITPLPNLSEDLVFSVVADDDDLALPFLALTKSLNPRMMVAIAKVGDAARKSVIAARGDCPLEAAAVIIRGGASPIVTELLTNFAVALTPELYQEILEIHGSDKKTMEKLAQRPDLPARLKVMMARSVSDEMRSMIGGDDIEATIKSQRMIDAAEEEAILLIASSTNTSERANLVSYLCDLKQLTPSLLLRAACQGEMPFVESALAILSGMQPMRVRNLMYSHGALSLRAVHSRANLPKVLFDPLRIAASVEKIREQNQLPRSKDHFGKQMIEAIVTGFENFSPETRASLLRLMQSYGSEKSRELASHLLTDQYVDVKSAMAA